MSDEFHSLDAIEKAAVEAALKRCGVLAAKIESGNSENCSEDFSTASDTAKLSSFAGKD
jgi:hypothetical protein